MKMDDNRSSEIKLSWRTRTLLAVLTCFLAASYLSMTYFREEPYPLLLLPSFLGSGAYDRGDITVRVYDCVFVTDDHDEIVCSPRKLLEQFPDSHHATIGPLMLSESLGLKKYPNERVERLLPVIGRCFPGFLLRVDKRSVPISNGFRDSLAIWMKKRSEKLVGGRKVTRVELRWYDEKVSIVDGNFEYDRVPVGTLALPLN